jgi:hypothetical protein
VVAKSVVTRTEVAVAGLEALPSHKPNMRARIAIGAAWAVLVFTSADYAFADGIISERWLRFDGPAYNWTGFYAGGNMDVVGPPVRKDGRECRNKDQTWDGRCEQRDDCAGQTARSSNQAGTECEKVCARRDPSPQWATWPLV